MKRSILAGISMLVVAIASPLGANATSQTTPSNLANLARNGYFQEQGIASHSALDTAITRGQVNAENLIEAAVEENRIAPETGMAKLTPNFRELGSHVSNLCMVEEMNYPYPVSFLELTDESLTDSAAIEKLLRNFVAKWTPERDMQFVQIRDRLAISAEYSRWTRAMARTWQMIYREPIRYELFALTQPTLLVIGLEDRIALGKNYVTNYKKISIEIN